jgi:hypothetical protein
VRDGPARTSRHAARSADADMKIGLLPPVQHEDDVNRRNTAATTVAPSAPSLR